MAIWGRKALRHLREEKKVEEEPRVGFNSKKGKTIKGEPPLSANETWTKTSVSS